MGELMFKYIFWVIEGGICDVGQKKNNLNKSNQTIIECI